MGALGIMGFGSVSEFVCYITAVMCGVSTLLPINAIFSAPLFIMNYYKYVTNDYDSDPQHQNFWDNAMTYYDLFILGVSLFLEPVTLTRWFRRIPLRLRMMTALGFLWFEIFILMIVPVIGWSEGGAIATIAVAGIISGFGKSVLDTTVYGMFCIFPPRFMAGAMAGMGISGILTSVIQIIIKAAMEEDDDGIRKQSQIYYGLMVGIQGVTFVLMFVIKWNSFAKPYLKALGSGDNAEENDNDIEQSNNQENDENNTRQIAEEPASNQLVEETHSNENAVISPPMKNEEDGYLVNTDIWFTFRSAFLMLLACAFNFLITLYLFPTIVIFADPDDYWFGTIAVFLFNVFDTVGRFAPTFKWLWLPRKALLSLSFARVVFVPLILLASFQVIPQFGFSYAMMVLFGFTNGYVGGLCLTLGPLSDGLSTSGHRFVAGAMLGMSILVGGSIGTGLSILTQGVRTDLD